MLWDDCGRNWIALLRGGSFAQLLASKGFEQLSYSDILRAELRAAAREVTRETMQEQGNAIRSEFGPGELSRRLLVKIDLTKKLRVDYYSQSCGN